MEQAFPIQGTKQFTNGIFAEESLKVTHGTRENDIRDVVASDKGIRFNELDGRRENYRIQIHQTGKGAGADGKAPVS